MDPDAACAWCHRVAAEGYWIDPSKLLVANLPPRIRDITSHGICPDCFGRLTDAAARAR